MISGCCAPGYEPVAYTFAQNEDEVGTGGAAFAVEHEGEIVVDLWTGSAGNLPWQTNTRAVLMSSTKGLLATVVARLVDSGSIAFEEPVASYWPEFARAGKDEITIAQVLSHTSGLISVPEHDGFLPPSGEGWDNLPEIAERLASATPDWAPGRSHGYHGLTIGWILDEVTRRATNMSIGEIVRREIAEPLDLDMSIGTPRELQARVATVIMPSDALTREQLLGDAIEDTSPNGRMALAQRGRSFLSEADTFFNSPKNLAVEIPAANGTGTARALAHFYGILSTGGSRNGYRLLSPRAIELFTSCRAEGIDRVTGDDRRWGLGFQLGIARSVSDPDYRGPHRESFGHDGFGGQLGYADPVSSLGIGFVRSFLSASSMLRSRLIDAVYRCM